MKENVGAAFRRLRTTSGVCGIRRWVMLFRCVASREAKRLPYGADERFCGFADRWFLVGAWYRRDVEGAVPYRWVDGTGNESGDPPKVLGAEPARRLELSAGIARRPLINNLRMAGI